MSKKYNAYEIVYKARITSPGSITIPATDADDAVERLKKFLGKEVDFADLEIESVTDVEEAPAFKRMIASYVINAEQEQEAFNKWLDQAVSLNKDMDIEDAEIVASPDDQLDTPTKH